MAKNKGLSNDIMKLWNMGLSPIEIAPKAGCTIANVSCVLRKRNINGNLHTNRIKVAEKIVKSKQWFFDKQKKEHRTKIKCSTCGNLFETNKLRIKKWGRKYCSARCCYIMRRKNPDLKLMRKMLDAARVSIPSKPQRKLYKIVKGLFPKAQMEYPFQVNEKKVFLLDIVVFDRKLNIESDGNFWHDRQKEKDTERDSILVENGWTVIRFNANIEKDINKEEVLDALSPYS